MSRSTRTLAVAITFAISQLAWSDAASACSSIPGTPTSFSAPQYRQWLTSFNGVVFRGTALCGITFELGKSYLIAADPPQQPKMNASTSGYWHTRNEKDFIAALGEGSPPPK